MKDSKDTHPAQSVLTKVGDSTEGGIRGLLADRTGEGTGHAIRDLLEENVKKKCHSEYFKRRPAWDGQWQAAFKQEGVSKTKTGSNS